MRAIVIHAHGGVDQLRPADLSQPKPGEHDLLVQVHATSVNPVDIKVRESQRGERPMPLVLGYDASGVVVACGAKVQGFQPGDEVFGCPSLFGQGAYAEYVLLDSRAAAHKPQRLNHAEAAALPLVSLTAWEALHERARIGAGQTVVIHGGAGGVGHVAIQLARLHGCRVWTTAGRPESIRFCRETLGADEVIDYKNQDFVQRIDQLTGGNGVPVVFDTVGGETFRRSIGCVSPCGQLVTILGSDPGDEGGTLLYRSITVHYEFMGARVAYGVAPERQGAILRSIAALADRQLLTAHISARFPLDEVAKGHQQVATGHTIGKVSIEVR